MKFLVSIIALIMAANVCLCTEQWKPVSLQSQPVHTLLIDPQNPENMYALMGAGEKNLWKFGSDILKTTDGGNTWRSILGHILKPSCIAIDPTRPDHIYVSGERTNQFGVQNAAVFKSTDGGENWNDGFIVHSDVEGWIYQLEISPADPNVLYVALQKLGQILYRSRDGGETWKAGWSGGVFLIYPDPVDADTLYILTYDFGRGQNLGVSVDGGITFDRMKLPNPPVDGEVDSVAVTPDHPGTLYATARRDSENWMLKSTDSGLTWETTPIDLEQRWQNFRILGVNPANPDVVYGDIDRLCAPPCAWSSQLLISKDGGGIWRSFMGGMEGMDFSALTFHPNRPEEIYASTKNGIYMIISGTAVTTDGAKKTTWGDVRSEP